MNDREILRGLAARVREIADLPEMAARKKRWLDHNALRPQRPLVLCFPEGAWQELCTDAVCVCADKLFRNWELQLRRRIYWWENIRDDNVEEPFFGIGWVMKEGDYGVKIETTHGENRGSYVWDPPIKDLANDLKKLKFRQPSIDRNASMERLELANKIFGKFLAPRLCGGVGWTMGLTQRAIHLIGLERMMFAMCDEPESLHALMGWLRDEHMNYIAWCENNGMLSINNRNGYTGSGGVAYTDELPAKDWKDGMDVRLKDLWGFAESQETVGVSPEMFGEFIFPCQLPLLEKFGLNCYGCCEPVHERWNWIKRIPRLRRISISPWCDQEKMAANMGMNYVFSRKPNPSMICNQFNEDEIRADLGKTIDIAGKLPLEIIMKDTHTVQNQPWRISKWVRIAIEEAEK